MQTFEGLLDIGFVIRIGDAKPRAITGKYLHVRLVSSHLVGDDGWNIPFGGERVFGAVEKLNKLVFKLLNKGDGKTPEVHGADCFLR